jgi:hypothetical protein
MQDFFCGLWFRVTGRCFVCDRLMALHTPWALAFCERTPLPIEITAKGWAALAAVEPVVPVSHAQPA